LGGRFVIGEIEMAERLKHLLVREEARGVAWVTLNRPNKLNALNLEVLEELCLALESLERAEEIRIIILNSAGEKAFIAGSDIEQMAGMGPMEFRRYTSFLRRLAHVMTQSEKTFIAAVRGVAFGGGNIVAMNCDFVFATEGSVFAQQEIDFGILGGIPRLIYLVGPRKAWDIVMTCRTVDASEAERIGLITKCIPEGEFEEYISNYVNCLIGKSDLAMRLAKTVKKISEKADLETAYEYENELISLCFDCEDTQERLAGFVRRRIQKLRA
jgi:enoyl-CoA hydratase/carnithine racemase